MVPSYITAPAVTINVCIQHFNNTSFYSWRSCLLHGCCTSLEQLPTDVMLSPSLNQC